MNDQDELEMQEMATEEPTGVFPHGAVVQLTTGNKTKVKAIKYPDGFTVELEKNGRRIVGVIERVLDSLTDETCPYKYIATVYEGDEIVFSIDTCPFGLCTFRAILKGAMSCAIMRMTHGVRQRQNRVKRAAAAAKNGGRA